MRVDAIERAVWSATYHAMRSEGVREDHAMAWADVVRIEVGRTAPSTWHHSPDAPPENFCEDCDGLLRQHAQMAAEIERLRAPEGTVRQAVIDAIAEFGHVTDDQTGEPVDSVVIAKRVSALAPEHVLLSQLAYAVMEGKAIEARSLAEEFYREAGG